MSSDDMSSGDMSSGDMNADASGHGRNYQAGRDLTHYETSHHYMPILESTIPGTILKVFGALLASLSFAGWASILFRAWASNGATGFGPSLPSGIPLAAFYFIGAGGGSAIYSLGKGMARAVDARRRRAIVGHALTAVVVIVVTFSLYSHYRDGAPYEYLLPHFASCASSHHGNGSDFKYPYTGIKTVTLKEWVCAK